ncbi:hypothetical protein WJX81_006342 [Elliptochloris bilobata]|uniref:B box-type domain-containing protein n=1 Tax=Elliptochloris bilobata TaxID=381761 RepID=A0AAW1SIQ1_9CHLO
MFLLCVCVLEGFEAVEGEGRKGGGQHQLCTGCGALVCSECLSGLGACATLLSRPRCKPAPAQRRAGQLLAGVLLRGAQPRARRGAQAACCPAKAAKAASRVLTSALIRRA